MQFSRISVADKKVALKWSTPVPKSSGVTTHELILPDKPLPSFTVAMQAFSGFALGLIGAPTEWDEDVKVTTLNFSEDSDGRRGVMVSISHKVEQAKGRAVSITTPVMHEADEDAGQGLAIAAPGYYGSVVADLIEGAEKEAVRYQKGEREQLELIGDESTAAEDDAPAPAPAKVRGSRKSKHAGTPGELMNADKSVPPTDEALRQALLTADRDVPVDAIAHWNSQERDSAQRWAMAVVEGVLNQKPTKLQEPECVQKAATLPLSAEDHWDEPNPLAGKAKDAQSIAAGD